MYFGDYTGEKRIKMKMWKEKTKGKRRFSPFGPQWWNI